VVQYAYELPNFKTKINLLHYLLRDTSKYNKVIVFVKTKKVADNIYKYLMRSTEGENRVIHSNKGQNTRINSLNAFKNGEVRILVSTDVAARGIDVTMVSHVINFEVPVVYEDYVHRIGRTGRAENTGVAITFYHPGETYHLKNIEKLINQRVERTPLPEAVKVETTGFEEQQSIDRAIDRQKKLADPAYQGAFHSKKKKAVQRQLRRKRKS
jgi:ATP-dependent RNA helicase RhlE